MSLFRNLIGKRINGVFLANDDWTLVFRTTDGEYHRYDTSNDCCNSVWVNHITGLNILGEGNSFDLLKGVLVTGAEDKGWGENRSGEDDYDVVQDGFWTLRTDRGYIDIEVRNSHNGYYGGSFEFNDDGIKGISDLREVREDF